MLLLFFLLFATPIFAQDSTDLYTKYRTDYLYQRDLYQQNYSDYLNKKDVYTQYGTVTAEKDKITATKNVFLSQNSLLKAYLMALRVTLNDSPSNQSELQKWENWLSTQNQVLANLNSTTALQNWAKIFQTQYVSIQKSLYTGLVQGQINRRLETITEIKKLATLAKIDWSSNFENKEIQINQKFLSAQEACQENQRKDEFSNFYPNAKKHLDQADIYIKNLISDLKSTIIKNN